MHVDRDDQSVKIWLDPEVRVAVNHGYHRPELRKIERIAHQHQELLRHEWDAFCHGNAGAAQSP